MTTAAKTLIPTATAALLLAIFISGWISGWGGLAHAQTALTPPTNVLVAAGDQPGAVNISWDAVPDAAYYRIGWVAYPDYEATVAAGRNWTDAFAYVDLANAGQTTRAVTRLTPGVRYAFIVASARTRYGEPLWSEWAIWVLAGAAATTAACPVEPTAPPVTFHGNGNDTRRVDLNAPGRYKVKVNLNRNFNGGVKIARICDDCRDALPDDYLPDDYLVEVQATGDWEVSFEKID